MARRLINHILAGTSHVLRDPRAELALEQIYCDAQRAADDANDLPPGDPTHATDQLGDFGYSLRPGQGEFLYLVCRSIGARRIVDFSTSAGATAIYCAAALRDNGRDHKPGTVISSDHREDRRAAAEHNLTEAGLIDYVDLRLGSPLDTLRDLPGPVDLAYLDGWPHLGAPSLALSVLELIRPALRPGALVLNDSHEADYLDHVRDPTSGFRTSVLDFGVLSVIA